jgi:hypothetical protein
MKDRGVLGIWLQFKGLKSLRWPGEEKVAERPGGGLLPGILGITNSRRILRRWCSVNLALFANC